MKVNGSVKPAALLFERRFDGTAEMRFRENIIKNDDGSYTYDEYFFSMLDRDGLEKVVQDNLPIWLAYARVQETDTLSAKIRNKRNKLLAGTDWTQTDDAPISVEAKESMRKYRQKLRDITAQSEFPSAVKWPEKPEITTVGNQSTGLGLLQQTVELQAQIAQMQINSQN